MKESIPMFEEAEIVDQYRGRQKIVLQHIKYLRTIKTDNSIQCQIHMVTNESYYIDGKDQFEVASDLGIQLMLYEG